MDSVSYRLATTEDVPTLVELRKAFLTEVSDLQELAGVAGNLHGALTRYFANALATGEFVAYLAVADGRVVASSGLVFYQHPPSTKNLTGLDAYLMNMYTLPDWRGRDIATQLLGKLIEFARERGCQWVLLHAMPAAVSLYERAGFTAANGEMRLDLRP
jgi:GNAT superfamily N-acetyltransferase